MNKFYVFFVLLFPAFVFAQKKSKVEYLVQSINGIQVDADLSDWPESLYENNSDLWSFAVSESEGKLYTAVRIKDSKLISEAVKQGVFVNLSYEDKKKDGAQLIYPVVNKELLSKYIVNEYETQTFTNEEMLNSVKGYYIVGFSKVIDGLLSFSNQYGINAVAKIDEQGHFIYESVIPLDLIKFKSNKPLVQIGINTQYSMMSKLMRQSQSRNTNMAYRGGYGRVGRPTATPKSPYAGETEVWFSRK